MNDLWAITAYFNPVQYRRRLLNFRVFRRHLQIPLVAVELAYGPRFELGQEDADILIQVRSMAVMWQKERLLNLALQSLPPSCRKVAWLDCDIIFDSPHWAEAANSLLDRFPLVQLFRQVRNLSPQWLPGTDYVFEAELTKTSAASLLALGMLPATCFCPGHGSGGAKKYSPGHAWAARREILDRHHFYDAAIIGGGDRAMACAALQCCDRLMELHRMNEQQRLRYISWAEPWYETIHGNVGFLDTELFHLWHGDYISRKIKERFAGLQQFEFDPYTDVAIDANGAWRWNTNKYGLHEYVHQYFAARFEDGNNASEQIAVNDRVELSGSGLLRSD